MSCKEINKKSIMEVFCLMDICDKLSNSKLQNSSDALKSGEPVVCNKMENSELSHILKVTTETKYFGDAVNAAVKAQDKWNKLTALERANSLHKVWKHLRNISKSMLSLENELLTLMNYFDFYADVAIHTRTGDENLAPCRVVLIAFSNYSPFFILGATVPPALAAGCSVIVLVPENVKIISLFLEEVMEAAGLPEGLFNTVAEFRETTLPFSGEVEKVVFCGSYKSALKLSTVYPLMPFNFFCPGNTAALILESADLDAAADKIVTERCPSNSVFAISTVVIQESVSKIFLEKFKFRMRQFMNTNKNSKYKDVPAEKVSKITGESLDSCAFVEKYNDFDNGIGQTVAVNYQCQDVDEDGTVLKVLICRTAREGVALLNNCRYNFGTSIWSEVSSQALEISSMLTCPNIWINSHGIFEASVPLQLLGFSGNCALGGSEGIFEYLSFTLEYRFEVIIKSANTENVNIIQIALSAQSAFDSWQINTNRRQYLKDVAESLEANNELSTLSDTISWFGHSGNLATSIQRNPQGCSVLRRKIPVGVFLLLVNTAKIDIKSFTTLITALVAFGNTVIVTLKEVNSAVNSLIKNFTNILPKNIIRVIVGIENGISLASHPIIKAVWIYDESAFSTVLLEELKASPATRLKRIWIIPKVVPASQHLLEKECLKSQVIWLTNIDQFP